MADGGSGEKTEEPTPERLRKLREEGNIPKSQDVVTAISFLVVFVALAGMLPWVADRLLSLIRQFIALATLPEAKLSIGRLMLQSIWTLVITTIPILAASFVVGVAMNVAQSGFLFTLKPITPDLNKINPINGAKNLLNMKKVVETLKTVAKFVIVSFLAYSALKGALRDVILMIRGDLMVGVGVIGGIIWDFTVKIGIAFIIIAAADAIYQRRRFIHDNMMTKHDIKQEYKQAEGDPQLKADRKRMHQELANGGGISAVKKSSVVVRNPDHIAIALHYEDGEESAPEVVAKGVRGGAEKILAEAKRWGIPIVRNVPLAQALNKLDMGDEIPEELYKAVAEVLTFVYKLAQDQKAKTGRGPKGPSNDPKKP